MPGCKSIGPSAVVFEGGLAEVHVFVLALGCSRRAYAEGFEHERIEALLAAHVVSAEAEEKE